MPPFHLAFPVRDLESTRRFYLEILGCTEGRSAATWVDLDLHGHQLSAHVRPDHEAIAFRNPVDGEQVPIPHFGVVLPWDAWNALADRLRSLDAEGHAIDWVIEPTIRFAGQPGEQGTFFLRDPSGNALEFKSFQDESKLFATS